MQRTLILGAGSLALLLGLGGPLRAQGRPAPPPPARVRVDSMVNEARLARSAGRFADAQRMLESALQECGARASGRDCRVTVAADLAEAYQQEGFRVRTGQQAYFSEATKYWDQVLNEDSSNTRAVYNKALVYQRGFFGDTSSTTTADPPLFYQSASKIDPDRKAVYLSFQGDYYMTQRKWDAAARSYRQALDADPDEESARTGLVEALRRTGRSGVRELLERGGEWALWETESAADAYNAALSIAVRESPTSGARMTREAELACLGLVSVQSRSGRSVGVAVDRSAHEWPPLGEIRAYLDRPVDPDAPRRVAPWWQANEERRTAFAEASLAGGRAALIGGDNARAASLWSIAETVAPEMSGIRIDLQRELALLLYRRPEMDPGGEAWKALERRMYEGKSVALASGDPEAAQRFHTALGLIYAARGQWRREVYARNASDQLTWALERINQRRGRERFVQPVPELRDRLARGLESIGNTNEARPHFLEAIAAYLDVNDMVQAATVATAAARAEVDRTRLQRLNSLAAFRTSLLAPGAGLADLCGATAAGAADGAGPSDFVQRQRFKIFADCSTRGDSALRLRSAAGAFELIDGNTLSLIGSSDVTRVQTVMSLLLGTVGIDSRSPHLDRVRPARSASLTVTILADTKPRWLTLAPDDLVAGRIVSALGNAARGLRMRISDGVVELTGTVPPEVVSRIRAIRGVVSVQASPRPTT